MRKGLQAGEEREGNKPCEEEEGTVASAPRE